MPYVDKTTRDEFDEWFIAEILDSMKGATSNWSEGDVNYLISRILAGWAKAKGGRYANYNAALGVLEAVKLELYRRMIAPYEDKKIKENGDLPEYEG